MSGAEFSLSCLLENMDRSRFNPILLLPEEGPFSEKGKKLRIETIILPSMIKFGEKHSLFKLPRIFFAILKTRRIIRRKKIRLVHSNSPRATLHGGPAAKLASVPSVSHVRDIYHSPFSHPRKGAILGSVSDAILTVSSATKDSILSVKPKLESKTQVVYNGVDFESLKKINFKDKRKEFGIDSSTPVIGCVGIIDPAKGQDILILASARIKMTFPTLKVLIIGSILLDYQKKFEEELKKLVFEHDLKDNVVFTGFREDIYDMLNALDVLVHPAVYPEPFPRTLLEASAIEKAIVATRVGGIPEMLENEKSAILVEPSNTASLANAVESLLIDKNKAGLLAKNAKQNTETNFSIDKHVQKITDIYDKLLGRNL